jgi:hypothetical protein
MEGGFNPTFRHNDKVSLLRPWVIEEFSQMFSMEAALQEAELCISGSDKAAPTTVKIGNLPYTVTVNSLFEILPDLLNGDRINFLFVIPDPIGRNCGGCAFVNFIHSEDAVDCQVRIAELVAYGSDWGVNGTRLHVQWSTVQGLQGNLEAFYSRFGARHSLDGLPSKLLPLFRGQDGSLQPLPKLPLGFVRTGAFGQFSLGESSPGKTTFTEMGSVGEGGMTRLKKMSAYAPEFRPCALITASPNVDLTIIEQLVAVQTRQPPYLPTVVEEPAHHNLRYCPYEEDREGWTGECCVD